MISSVVGASVSIPFSGDVSPVSPAAKSGPLELRLTILPSGCDQISLTVSTAANERYGVGDETWIRSKGEYKFRKLEPITDINALIEELKQQRGAVSVEIR